jgi:isopropylmalate/homocitrate/citramalate synthase
MLGLGDGAGITSGEEVALALEVLYGVETGLNLEKITELCQVVKEIFDIQISPHKPFVGENIYRHQIDSHFAAILRKGWHTWEVVKAEALGRERRLELASGKLRRGRSGAIAAKLENMGLEADDWQFDQIFEEIQSIVEEKKFVSEDEIERVIRCVIVEDGD